MWVGGGMRPRVDPGAGGYLAQGVPPGVGNR
jgi:hypothetical protein